MKSLKINKSSKTYRFLHLIECIDEYNTTLCDIIRAVFENFISVMAAITISVMAIFPMIDVTLLLYVNAKYNSHVDMHNTWLLIGAAEVFILMCVVFYFCTRQSHTKISKTRELKTLPTVIQKILNSVGHYENVSTKNIISGVAMFLFVWTWAIICCFGCAAPLVGAVAYFIKSWMAGKMLQVPDIVYMNAFYLLIPIGFVLNKITKAEWPLTKAVYDSIKNKTCVKIEIDK